MEFEVWKEQVNPKKYSSLGEWTKANKWVIILSPVYLVFRLVAVMLALMAKLVGITYKEMNIFVYYFVIPLSWCALLDIACERLWSFPLFSCLWCVLWAFIIFYNRHGFRAWCVRAFDNSVKFLLWFQRIGWNYYVSSVIICVIIPILVYWGLISYSQTGISYNLGL